MFDHFRNYAKAVKPALDGALTACLSRMLGNGTQLLPNGARDLLAGGKKIRGTLVCLVSEVLGGALEDALPRAVAVELIQTATLIHDDFVDQHRSRRNRPALWTIEGGRRAVLLGDVIFASAIHMMSKMGRDDGLIVSGAIADVAVGAYREPPNTSSLVEGIKTGTVDGGLYEKIIYLKTGVLFGAACQLGAAAAGADEGLRQVWRNYGRKIGEAYQIADDLHELERCLVARSVTLEDVAELAPALLFFAGEERPGILEILRRDPSDWNGGLEPHFRRTAQSMKAEVERRLQSALRGIEGNFLDTDIYRLACKTPWDIIRMFDETATRASSP